MNDFQNPEESNIEYGKNGVSNTYRINEPVEDEVPQATGEYITIYNPQGSFKSKLLSIVTIIGVLLFCWLVFKFIFSDKTETQQTQAASANAARLK